MIKKILLGKINAKKENYINKFIDTSIDEFKSKLKMRYGYEYEFNGDVDAAYIHQVNEILKKYDKKYNDRKKGSSILTLPHYIINVDENTFIYVKGFIANKKSNESLYIYIFGKYANKYNSEFAKSCTAPSRYTSLELFLVTGSGSNSNHLEFNSTLSDLNKRELDSLYFDNGIKNSIINHIDTFIKNEDLYKNKNIICKTGILLYGEPGTGKTSLATAIATYCNSSLIIVDINTFAGLDIAVLTNCINADKQRFVILLEDIDTVFSNLDRKDDLDREESKVVNKLLQFLDSNSSPNNVIFVATTNHYDKIDPALLRDGRFDLKVNVSSITDKNVAIEMCKSFGCNDSKAKEILDQFPKNKPINQSKLQNAILRSMKGDINEE